MTSYLLAIPAIVAAYLIGAIPFGYLIALWFRGLDIRTVGSGNIGATNVGRTLGLRFFFLVFFLDLLKGFLPTYGFPLAVDAVAGRIPPGFGVLVGLAAILGHNFPVYLKFRGGKGVATSLGAFLALDWIASLASAIGFVVFLLVTRYVSLSSLLGGMVFLGVYWARVKTPWDRDHLTMTIVTLGLVALLFVRHRNNLVRIGAGTEPKVFLRKQKPPPAGRVSWILVVVLALAALGTLAGLTLQTRRPSELIVGGYRLTEVARAGTGHQRAERLAFADGGKLLAVTCPRYNRVVIYRVTDRARLEEVRDVALDGKPVAVCATRDRFYLLERPPGDARHVEPGWWETLDFTGRRVGPRVRAGMYPDDLAVTPDERHVLVLTSGKAEGDAKRPAPSLDVFMLGQGPPRVCGRLEFDAPGDDPVRLTQSLTGQCAAVTLAGSEQVAAIDLDDPGHPRAIGRTKLPEDRVPHLSSTVGDAILLAVAPERDAVAIHWPGSRSSQPQCVVCTLPRDSNLTFIDPGTRRMLGRLPLRGGSLGLTATRPTGLAYSAERGLLAVANRSGGVHLIVARQVSPGGEGPSGRVAFRGDRAGR